MAVGGHSATYATPLTTDGDDNDDGHELRAPGAVVDQFGAPDPASYANTDAFAYDATYTRPSPIEGTDSAPDAATATDQRGEPSPSSKAYSFPTHENYTAPPDSVGAER